MERLREDVLDGVFSEPANAHPAAKVVFKEHKKSRELFGVIHAFRASREIGLKRVFQFRLHASFLFVFHGYNSVPVERGSFDTGDPGRRFLPNDVDSTKCGDGSHR